MGGRGRPIAAIAVAAAGAALAIACGSFGSSGSSPKPIADASVDAAEAPEPPEDRVLSFPCGDTKCFAGEQACCQVGAMFSCVGLEAGGCPSLPSPDGGPAADAAPAGPALLCTSYRNCPLGDDCCYRKDEGSSCQGRCPSGAENLCTIGMDGCGSGAECKSIQDPPQAGVGGCKDTSYFPGGSSGHF